MRDKKTKYTPWTIPQSDWSSVLDQVNIDSDTRQELVDAIKQFDRTALNERVRAYETQVTNETMSKLVK